MTDEKSNADLPIDLKGSLLDSLRQLAFPPEFRIAAPQRALDDSESADAETVLDRGEAEPKSSERSGLSDELAAEFGTCLWYLKTKFFKLNWANNEGGNDDPRIRRALGRLNKSVQTLKDGGIEVHDPTNERYPEGGEGTMRPIQFVPTPGLTYGKVSETVTPIVYRADRLIQRGEVYVSVPVEDPEKAADAVKPQAAAGTPAGTTGTAAQPGNSRDAAAATAQGKGAGQAE